MIPSRNGSTVGTAIGLAVFVVAIVGSVFLDWTWENPEGKLLPLLLGVGAATVAVLVAVRLLRS